MTIDGNPTKADPHDSVYDGLLGENEGHWAFGSFDVSGQFDDPLAGVDTTVPEGIDHVALAAYCLMLGDDALIMSQQLAKWTAKAPDLEEDVALSNTALDLLGQARLLLARAAAADPAIVPVLPEGSPVPADDALAYFRGAGEFRNVGLVEPDNGDFAATMARLLIFTVWRLAIFQRLAASRDPVLAAVAAKGIKEMTYHRDYSARWVVTLAQGTEESRARMIAGLAAHWPYVEELFTADPIETALAESGVGADPSDLRTEFDGVLREVLGAADLVVPDVTPAGGSGRAGVRTDALDVLLGELQSVARAHPMGRW